ncbi:hypothetical protein [Streptomyces sp. 891-h]|uniref:hypothetical protein n=1 Tax=Streptomyces sp. 891-h TaxID=2720714 RepID=UPI001FA9F9D4|nr:hypothetical protein [Streptomyces sp. 891-h]UNZ21315.1 hypothetical protein HC362_33910 [Streptomyces sp. 891-h]
MTSRTEAPVPLPADHRVSETYADWARTRGPGAESTARAVLDEVVRKRGRAWEKPGRFVDEMESLARGLPAAHLPWFWDTVGHWLLETRRRSAARAYGRARAAERDHGLRVDSDWRRANVLLFARFGALPATELSGYLSWLAGIIEPGDAHREFVRLLTTWAASPGELPADLARRVRDSARAAGLGTEEEARVLAGLLAAARGKAVPDRLLDAAAGPLTAHPPTDDQATGLLDLFPESKNDAAAWLRLLIRCGAADAAAAGRITPEGGLGNWLRHYCAGYSHRPVAGGGVVRQPMPVELLDVVGRFAPLLRAAGTPVRLHEDRYGWPHLDADLLDLCLAEGIPVEDPGAAVRLEFWDERSQRDLKALAADPVFGPRLEGTVHAGLRTGGGTAITRLPHNPGVAAEVHARIEKLLEALRGGGLAAADEAVDELRDLLDRPTANALDGIEEALDALDLTGPLARALRAGLPEELSWPALEQALAEFRPDETVHVTCTWPVLTVYGDARAIAVDHAGRRGEHTLELPDASRSHTVHWVGGRFFVAWNEEHGDTQLPRAYWSDLPKETFTSQEAYGLRPYGGSIQGGLGYQFETPDGEGRFDGERVLRAGGREGIGHRDYQMSDGRAVWSCEVFGDRRGGWARVDPHTGIPTDDRALPAFHRSAEAPPGTEPFTDHRILAALPPGAPPSPLGQDGRLTGCRVHYRSPYAGPSPRAFVLETIDGRTASYRSRRFGRRPWGILALPLGGEDIVMAGETTVRAHAAEDNSLLWQVRGFPGSRDRSPVRATLGEQAGPMPPPAYWHFLTPRDEASSETLRAVTDTAVRRLLRLGTGSGNDAPHSLPGVIDPRIQEGVARAARLAADVLRRRRELSHRVAVMRSAPVVDLADPAPDTRLTPALRGLLPELRPYEAQPPQPQPALLTAVGADGRYLRGEIDDEVRVLALPATPPEWAVLTGRIDAVAWRAATAATPDQERQALIALLGLWSRQPFAEAGSAWRTGRAPSRRIDELRAAGALIASGPVRSGLAAFLHPAADPAPADAEECETHTIAGDDTTRLPQLLALLAEHGPLPVPEEAVDLFRWRTGVPRPIAALVLDGFPGRDDYDEHRKLLRTKPYKADQVTVRAYEEFCRRLGPASRRTVLAAALPADPAALWAPGGMTAAADRMAAAWAGLLGTGPYLDDGSHAAALAADRGLPDTWAAALLTGRAPKPMDADGIRAATTAVTWALTERPVGDPARAGARTLIDGLTNAPADLLTALRRLADRSAATPVPPGQYETNPLFSAPLLVDEAAAALDVCRDAAALHLQLLALDCPTDRTLRRWNTWTLDHHRAVRKELTAAKAPRPAPPAPADDPAAVALPVPVHERFARAWADQARPRPRRG